MARTIRNKQEGKIKRKLRPYSKKYGKFLVEPQNGTGITKLGKLVTKNANRSLKKKIRQMLKKEILDYE